MLAVWVAVILWAGPALGQLPSNRATDQGGSAGLSRGDQLPIVTLSYVVAGSTKTIDVDTDALPDQVHFSRVAIFPNQTLQIRLAFPSTYAGQIIFASPAEEGGGVLNAVTPAVMLPAGTVAPPGGFVVGTDGAVVISYQAPADPGRYHVVFRFGPLEPVLPLTVLNSAQAAQTLNCPKAH